MTYRVDVHAHFVPDVYRDALGKAGIQDVDGFPLPSWSPEAHIGIMDRNKISTSLLSLSAPGLNFVDGQTSRSLARAVNEENARHAADHPFRFGSFAVLPLPDVDGALDEIAHAIDVLKMDGIGLYTNINGTYLGDPRFTPIFEELNRRNAVVFTHPVVPPNFNSFSVGYPGPMIEFPFDTTRMVVSLIGADLLRRFPNVRIILSHGGGTIPYLVPRLAPLVAMFQHGIDPPLAPSDVIEQLKAFYYDVTATSHAFALDSLTLLVPRDHLLYGSDAPFMPESSIPPALDALATYPGFTPAERTALDYGNATQLFPRVAARISESSSKEVP